MRGLARKQASEDVYVFALEIADDFAAVFKAANTESHYQRSGGGAASRWQPSGWFATGMEIEIELLNELLVDPTFQRDPGRQAERPRHQAVWLKVMVDGLRLAREAGHLRWAGRPIAAFCTVQDSGLSGWMAFESARRLNPPELWELIRAEFTEAWADWQSDDAADEVRAAFESL